MSGAYGEPDWATPGATTAPTTTQSEVPSAGAISASGDGDRRSGCILSLLSLLNMGLCGMMTTLGVLGLLDFDGKNADDFSNAFVAVYMIIFAMLLFVYELMWWKSITPLNKSLRKNFGFLYGIKGKAFYMIFIAFMTIGLESQESLKVLRWATGIAFLTCGCLHVFILCARPEISSAYRAPTGGFDAVETNNPV